MAERGGAAGFGGPDADFAVFCALCLGVYLWRTPGEYAAVPVLAAAAAAGFGIAAGRAAALGLLAAYAALSVFFPALLLLLPVAACAVPASAAGAEGLPGLPSEALPGALCVFPLAAAFAAGRGQDALLALGLLALGVFFRMRGAAQENLRQEGARLRDEAREGQMRLAEKNRDLLARQDYEVSLATMGERNRIARDIHDSVGHLLSSALLQVGALLATCRDDGQRQALEAVRATLSQAMESIRASVHGLYDDSIDLSLELRRLAESFTFCPVRLDDDLATDPGRKAKLALLAIAGEALQNVARHSNATRVDLRLHEAPAFYQLVVKDNGTAPPEDGTDAGVDGGIGLASIAERVAELDGIFNAGGGRGKGFRVFVTIPKRGSGPGGGDSGGGTQALRQGKG